MKRILTLGAGALLIAGLMPAQQQWSPRAAASYLDGRMDWWMAWPSSARDHETFCVSCHTAVPYAISRYTLRTPLAEKSQSATEQKLLANVAKRVSIWNEAEPFYSDKDRGANKTKESRGTESILNALILVVTDSEKHTMGDSASKALSNMWAQQIVAAGDRQGSFEWLDFHNRPWEADDSPYYGAALAAVAAGSAPSGYLNRPELQDNLNNLRGYLKREFAKQSPLNRMAGLWADSKIHGVLTAEQRSALIDEIFSTQQADGGWSLTSIAGTWKRRDTTALETKSDGYATGLMAFVLAQSGMPHGSAKLAKAISWLNTNQSASEGFWPGWSLNKDRHDSEQGMFMDDASTAYAVLALTSSK